MRMNPPKNEHVTWITVIWLCNLPARSVKVLPVAKNGQRSEKRGCGSVGRASPCQGEGRGFESRHPLRGAGSAQPQHSHGGLAERLGTGLQSRLHRFESGTHLGRLAQRERASLTRKRSLVRSQYRPPAQASDARPGPSSSRRPAASESDPPLRRTP